MPNTPEYLFQKIAKDAKVSSIDYRNNAREAITWFRNMAYTITRSDPKRVLDSAGPFERVINLSANSIGKMYFFEYDAKWKDKLPYWDRFPIIFPIEFYPETNSMLGINLHYLYPYQRAKLMDQLWSLANNEKYDKTTKLKISYQLLKNASQFSLFKPCVKKYLFSHVRSPFINIKAQAWDYGMMLPLARFQKMNQNAVWVDSARIARGQQPFYAKQKRKKRK